jgi:hypothetical protein
MISSRPNELGRGYLSAHEELLADLFVREAFGDESPSACGRPECDLREEPLPP